MNALFCKPTMYYGRLPHSRFQRIACQQLHSSTNRFHYRSLPDITTFVNSWARLRSTHRPDRCRRRRERKSVLILPINFVSQSPRAPERCDLPCPQPHVLTSLGVPTPALVLFVNAELAEPADKNILPGFQGSLDDFQDGFDHLSRFRFGQPKIAID